MLTLFHNFQVTTYIVITVILLAAAYPPPSAIFEAETEPQNRHYTNHKMNYCRLYVFSGLFLDF